ncbi:hypothetical protein [Oleiharenicola sp. Vm1]|uniref:hypothetical protein n=1 Tax=Oleiharenicola sp. Vm1 TaxID=3398393 RepID=UPI0039F63615
MNSARVLARVGLLFLAACAKKETDMPIARWESPAGSPRHVSLVLFAKRSEIRFDDIEIEVATVVRGNDLIWQVDPDKHGRPVQEAPFAEIQNDRSLLIRAVPGVVDDARQGPYRLMKKPAPASHGK